MVNRESATAKPQLVLRPGIASPEELAAEIFPIQREQAVVTDTSREVDLIQTDRGRQLDFHGRQPSVEELWSLLETVPDPEVPVVSVVDLGIVRRIELQQGIWKLWITPTYSGCPATELIRNEIELAVRRAGLSSVEVLQQLSPAWTTDWISEEGRQKLKDFGIAPPGRRADREGEPDEQPGGICCPRCDSPDVRRISEFGSTACKALYQCQSCQEPFDYFKCL